MSSGEFLKTERDGHVAWLILNRPEKKNAMTLKMFDGLGEAFMEFDRDPEVRVVVVRGEGSNFTAGIDLAALADLNGGTGADAREELRRHILGIQAAIGAAEKCRKPVIAAIHSQCIGGGVDLACACDIRLASRDAVFSIRETRLAIVADLGTLQRLPRIVGEGWCRELSLTGRDFDAAEALGMGFVTRVCPDGDELFREAARLADRIASCSPLAVQGTKDVLNFDRDHGLWAGLEYVAQKNAAILMCEDVGEAVRAFKEKRPPEFKGR